MESQTTLHPGAFLPGLLRGRSRTNTAAISGKKTRRQAAAPENYLSPKNIRVRLIIALPVILSLFMIVSGWALARFMSASLVAQQYIEPMRALGTFWTLVMTALAFIGSFVAAYLLTGQMRNLIVKVESLLPQDPNRAETPVAANELDLLRIMLDGTLDSVQKFAQHSRILDGFPEALINVDLRGEVLSANQEACAVLGMDPVFSKGAEPRVHLSDTVLGRTLPDLLKEIETSGRTIDCRRGSLLPHGRDGEFIWVRATPLLSPEKTVEGYTVTLRDRSDLLNLADQLEKVERLAEIGGLAATMAHEARNPLAAMKTLVELMREDSANDGGRSIYIKEVLSQINRLNRIFEDTLSLSREPVLQLEQLKLSELIAEAVAYGRNGNGAHQVKIVEECDHGGLQLTGDRARLSQALGNIVKNALEASRGEEAEVRLSSRLNSNREMVTITISDSGPGIDPKIQPEVFQPLFTTKPNGTGLGLTLARRIVAAHGGVIAVSSRPDRGATFDVTLPLKLFSLKDGTQWNRPS